MKMRYKNKAELISNVISPGDVVLDIGFWGQGVSYGSPNWVHGLLKARSREVYGVDLTFDESLFPDITHYQKASAESFDFPVKFDVVFAGDLVEHLPNTGLFLDAARRVLRPGGKIVITTPNCFNLFHMAEKLTKDEPTVNHDHTCYFNTKTLSQLLVKQGFKVSSTGYLFDLGSNYRESFKKRALNFIYFLLSKFTLKFYETIVVVAVPRESQ